MLGKQKFEIDEWKIHWRVGFETKRSGAKEILIFYNFSLLWAFTSLFHIFN